MRVEMECRNKIIIHLALTNIFYESETIPDEIIIVEVDGR